MNKNYLLISLFVLIACVSFKAYSQEKNRITVFSGVFSDAVFANSRLGAGSQEHNGSTFFGIRYLRNLNNSFSIETGLEYSSNRMQTAPAFYPGIDRTPTKEVIQMVSVPFYGNLTFLRHLFINAGAIVDFETNISDNRLNAADNQSGIGFGFGVGGKYTFKKITFIANPFFQSHAVIPFETKQSGRLMELGVRVGAGYNF